jgi:hypothetical protein
VSCIRYYVSGARRIRLTGGERGIGRFGCCREFSETAPLAVVVDRVSEKWNQNVLQIMAAPGRVHVEVAGHGVVTEPAFRLSRNQARRSGG